MPKILIVDDEPMIRETLREILEFEKFEVEEAEQGKHALSLMKRNKYDVILCDIKMPEVDGMEVLEKAQELAPDTPVIMISGHGTVDTAVDATKKGAFDFISKPPDLNRLLVTVRNAIDRKDLVNETKTLKRKVTKTRDIIGESEPIKEIKKTIDKVAPTEARVLITGENGTGKELVALWLHEKSNRSDGPMVEVNCAAIPSELIESELFGHEKGSFTSAIKKRIGKFEAANGGTLFLDEIGDMSLSAQAKVLRALQESLITRVGGDKPLSVDVRVIAATNKNLYKEIEKGNFREDLFHRLSVILMHVPPLRDRKDDIPLLANSFLEEILQDYGMAKKEFEKGAFEEMKEMEWTGNIRELRNVVERLAILSGTKITADDVHSYARSFQVKGTGHDINVNRFDKYSEFMDYMESLFLKEKLRHNNYNLARTSDEIGLDKSILTQKLDRHGLKAE